jgi:hypothetical protein
LRARPVRLLSIQRLRKSGLEVCNTHFTEGRDDRLHQAIEDAVVVGRQRREYPIREVYGIRSGLDGNHPEILACRSEDIPDRTVAVVHAIDHRFGKRHEPPYQIQCQLGAGHGDPLDDHRPLQVEVFHEVPPFLPIDEGSRILQGGDAFADFGGDGVTAGLRGQF